MTRGRSARRRSLRLDRRQVVLGVVALLVAVLAWTAWIAFRTVQDLRDARRSATDLVTAIEAGDARARVTAFNELAVSSDAAARRTDGPWWGAVTLVPWVGDDAAGMAAISRSLDDITRGSVDLLQSLDEIQTITDGGRIDLEAVEALQKPVDDAQAAFASASRRVDRDSSGYLGALQKPFDSYAATVADFERSLVAGSRAVSLAPAMLGGDGPRDYLLLFQNNAEVRATGGQPGSYAWMHADDGVLTFEEQGSPADFPVYDEPVVALTAEERRVYGPEIGRFFQNPGFTPHFPRAAQIFNGFWQRKHPDVPLDGVIAIDPVALGYLLKGAGPVTVDGLTVDDVTLTSSNASQILLNQIYLDIPDPDDQDTAFQRSAKAIFEASRADVDDLLTFLAGMARAGDEGRLLVAPADSDEIEALAGTRVAGELSGDDGATPHVDIGLNDGTASKMSYYLRHVERVEAVSCADGVQTLEGSMTLTQTITREEAERLPDYVTGGGLRGFAIGEQLVFVRIYGPYGGTISDVAVDGEPLEVPRTSTIGGRPVTTVGVVVDSPDGTEVTWSMTSGPGQAEPGVLQSTVGPSLGGATIRFESSSC